MATAADNQPEEVDGNAGILGVQYLDYSGLHYTTTIRATMKAMRHLSQSSCPGGRGKLHEIRKRSPN
jgi:hypothetical protein